MRNCAGRILGNLRGEQMPDHENKTENRGENAGYTFPVPARREAVIVESSSQYTVFSAELSAVDGFSGRILPYVNALDDRYFVPQLRFQGGAYSASFAFTPTMDRIVASTYRDPKVSETIEAIRAAAGVLEKLQLSEADRNGYILSSYGNATAPCGCLGRRMAAMQYAYNGLDIVQIRRWTEEIRKTTAEDQKEAARIIRRLLEEAWIVTTGNQTAIEMDRDCFDRIRISAVKWLNNQIHIYREVERMRTKRLGDMLLELGLSQKGSLKRRLTIRRRRKNVWEQR